MSWMSDVSVSAMRLSMTREVVIFVAPEPRSSAHRTSLQSHSESRTTNPGSRRTAEGEGKGGAGTPVRCAPDCLHRQLQLWAPHQPCSAPCALSGHRSRDEARAVRQAILAGTGKKYRSSRRMAPHHVHTSGVANRSGQERARREHSDASSQAKAREEHPCNTKW